MFINVFLNIYLTICSSIFLYLPSVLDIYLYACLSTRLSIDLLTYPSVSIFRYINLSLSLSRILNIHYGKNDEWMNDEVGNIPKQRKYKPIGLQVKPTIPLPGVGEGSRV